MAAKPVIIVRQPFFYDSDAVSASVVVECLDVSRTDQSQALDADINTLVKRFGITGEVPQLQRVPLDSDFIGLTSFQECQNAIIEAGKTFLSLPAHLRERFHHDPGEFVDFCSDEKNKDELSKLGLLKEPEPEFAPFKVEVVDKAVPPA